MVMGQNNTIMKINEMPAKTWYRLNLNEVKLPWTEGGEQKTVKTDGEESPVFLTLSGTDYEKKIIEINAGEGEEKVICMNYGEFAHLNVEIQIQVADNACVKLIQLFRTKKDSVLINRIRADVAKKGTFSLYQMAPESGDLYLETLAELTGESSSFTADVGYLAGGRGQLDINMVVNHYGAGSQSKIRADGALKEEAVKTFRGTIDFKQGSANAAGEETETVLMLGEKAENRTIPVILCREETVSGSHGATIGELDEDTLFYFESRGIGRKEAEEILSEAAIRRIAGIVATDETKEWLREGLKEENEEWM